MSSALRTQFNFEDNLKLRYVRFDILGLGKGKYFRMFVTG